MKNRKFKRIFASNPANIYSAILMYVYMPIMDGLTAAKTITIIAMTANAFDEDCKHLLDAVMNTHLIKPIEPEKIYARLAELIKETMQKI